MTARSNAPLRPAPIVLTGTWGGDHVALTVTDTSSHLEFDCAHGEIPGALTVDAIGMFAVAGTFVREHGGPVRNDEVPDAHPAVYGGAVTGTTMQLTVRLAEANEVDWDAQPDPRCRTIRKLSRTVRPLGDIPRSRIHASRRHRAPLHGQ